ncbi:hypothetical protein BU16DRAFT_591360 [Lophium mytilinum]|uniref:Uncharacterized protein n=1 Tax=Lophium mytilinum TaxID=390894 RepID=A0A6A6QQ87_9PEZI|nr:hypothetical protein BU16DRAFT_591360 [Lophium mytilinum]
MQAPHSKQRIEKQSSPAEIPQKPTEVRRLQTPQLNQEKPTQSRRKPKPVARIKTTQKPPVRTREVDTKQTKAKASRAHQRQLRNPQYEQEKSTQSRRKPKPVARIKDNSETPGSMWALVVIVYTLVTATALRPYVLSGYRNQTEVNERGLPPARRLQAALTARIPCLRLRSPEDDLNCVANRTPSRPQAH